jgi:putative protein kinase ArgK-like GTPase of G3E family
VNAKEFCEHHLRREARARANERMRALKEQARRSPGIRVTAQHIQDAVSNEPVAPTDETIRQARKKLELCEFIAARFADEDWPEDVKRDIAQRAVWLRELIQKARADGLFVE